MMKKVTAEETVAVEISDLGSVVVYLNSGDYLINGDPYKIEGYNWQEQMLELDKLEDIRKIDTHRILSEYQDKDGNILSVDDYEKELEELISKGEYKYDSLCFEDLDDEYNYKKFKRRWTKIYKTVQKISEPLKIGRKVIKMDTGNEFINNAFGSVKGNDLTVYQYSQRKARVHLLHEKMKSLGMQFEGDVNYSRTGDRKVYGLSHTGIRYAVAFGTYIFDNGNEGSVKITDTYENCLNRYEKDKEWLDKLIQKKYNHHFNVGNLDNVDVDKLMSKLNFAKTNLLKVNPFKKTVPEYNRALRAIRETLEILEDAYKE